MAFQIQEQKPQKFKIFQANNRVWTKFESKKKQTPMSGQVQSIWQ